MTKKVSTIKSDEVCRDCFYCIPDMTNLSFATGEPIMGSCKYQKYKFLLSQKGCKEYGNKSM